MTEWSLDLVPSQAFMRKRAAIKHPIYIIVIPFSLDNIFEHNWSFGAENMSS